MASKLTTTFRVVLGVLFLTSGGIKLPRIGQAVVPDTHKYMAKEFGKYLRVAPFAHVFKINSVQYMTFAGYTEVICGFLLLSNQLTALASTVLAVFMVGGAYTHYALKDPLQRTAVPAVLCAILVYIALTCSAKKKQKNE